MSETCEKHDDYRTRLIQGYDYELKSDGSRVCLVIEGKCVARFSTKLMEIVLKVKQPSCFGGAGLLSQGPLGAKDWEHFVETVRANYGVQIPLDFFEADGDVNSHTNE